LADRAAAVGAVDPRATTDVEHARVPDPALPAGPERRRVSPHLLGRGVDTLGHRERREHEPLRVHVARLRRVPAAHVEPVQPETFGEGGRLRLYGERGLGVAVAAHRAGVRVVRVPYRRVEWAGRAAL